MRTVTLFISSTADSFEREIALLRREVIPELERHCGKQGWELRVSDVRQGVGGEYDYASLERRLSQFDEARHAIVLFLDGGSSRENVLPLRIPGLLADTILDASDHEEAEIILEAYKPDYNSVPGELRLVKPDEERVVPLLRAASEKLRLSEEQRSLLLATAAERELQAIRALPGSEELLVCASRATGSTLVSGDITYDMDTDSAHGGLRHFSRSVTERLSQCLDNLFSRVGSEDDEEDELHSQEAQLMHERFAARGEEMRAGEELFIDTRRAMRRSGHPIPLFIVGERGCGCSYLMAELATRLGRDVYHKWIIRFVGLTDSSSNAESLLASIRTRDAEAPLFVDGLDRIDDPRAVVRGLLDDSRTLPIVFSVTEGCLEKVRDLLPEDEVEAALTPIELEQASMMLDSQLEHRGRTATDEQRKAVLDAFRSRPDGRLLRLLVSRLASMTSYEGADALVELGRSADVDALDQDMVDDSASNTVTVAIFARQGDEGGSEPQGKPEPEMQAETEPGYHDTESTTSEPEHEVTTSDPTMSMQEASDLVKRIAEEQSAEHRGEPLSTQQLNACFRAVYSLGREGDAANGSGPSADPVSVLRFMETYVFLERCGAITKEAVENTSIPAIAPALFLRGRELALAALPESLRALIGQREGDPEFFVSTLNDAYQALFPTVDLDRAESYAREAAPYDPAKAPGRDVDRETAEERASFLADLAASAAAFAMMRAYSVFDRIDDAGGEGAQGAKRELAHLLMEQLNDSREQLKDQITFYESGARGRSYMEKLSRMGK